jgi:hypothetical protein
MTAHQGAHPQCGGRETIICLIPRGLRSAKSWRGALDQRHYGLYGVRNLDRGSVTLRIVKMQSNSDVVREALKPSDVVGIQNNFGLACQRMQSDRTHNTTPPFIRELHTDTKMSSRAKPSLIFKAAVRAATKNETPPPVQTAEGL